jgi:hypothetical protein
MLQICLMPIEDPNPLAIASARNGSIATANKALLLNLNILGDIGNTYMMLVLCHIKPNVIS